MSDVAQRAGVSRSTASFALNGRQDGVRIPEETRRRILAAAEELGYRPNQLARAVVTGKSRFLGLLMKTPDKDVESKSRILAGVSEGAAEAGYTVKVLYLPSDGSPEGTLRDCIQWRLAGLVTVGLDADLLQSLRPELAAHDILLAEADGSFQMPIPLWAGIDEAQTLRTAVGYLAELGHRRFACIGGAESESVSRKFRVLGEICDELGLNFKETDAVYGDAWEIGPNQQAAQRLLGAPDRPTAVICLGDPIAVVLLNVARSLGLSVPGDLSVVGYGNYSLGWYSDPPLTTLAPPLHELGRQLVRRMIQQLESGIQPLESEPILLPAELLQRGSAAPPL